MKKRYWLFGLLLPALLCACIERAEGPRPLASVQTAFVRSGSFAGPAEEPESFTISVKPVTPAPTVTPQPTPSPTPSPTPTPSPVPFSYYAPTVSMSFEELIGGLPDSYYKFDSTVEQILPVGYPAADTYRVIVDEYWQVVLVYGQDRHGNYTVPVRYMLCSTGRNGATRKGIFPLEACRVRFGKFAAMNMHAQYWSLIVSRTFFHSILYNKGNDFSSLSVASYEALGKAVSHGCIRLTVPDARWIYYNLCYGTEIEIRQGSADDAATAAIREQLVLPPVPDGWPYPLPFEDVPWTDNWAMEDVDTQMPYVSQTARPSRRS